MSKSKMPAGVPDGRLKKIQPKDWLEIIALAQAGKSVIDIALQFGVDRSVIYKGLRARSVNVTAIAQRLAREEAEKLKKDLVEKIKETKEFDYRATMLLQRELLSVVAEVRREKTSYGDKLNDMKALKIAIEAIKLGTENKWRVLGLDKENEDADKLLPELPISVMTDEEVNQMRHNQEMTAGLTDEEIELLDIGETEVEIEDIPIVDEE